MRAVISTYPDDSIQNLCSSWWQETDEKRLEYGRLVWAFLPHVDQQPSVLVARGRSDPEDHHEADFRRAEYPQYSWDRLPIGGADESILRLDHLQPLGVNAQAVEVTPYRLSTDAAEVIEEWLEWFRMGALFEEGVLAYYRSEMGYDPG